MMNFKMLKHTNGFTLIETIMVILILAIVAAVSSPPLIAGYKAYQTHINITNAGWQSRYALERMARDIQAIASSSSISIATASSITFANTTSETITYSLVGSQIVRNNSAGLNTNQVLADGITSTTLFQYYNTTGTLMTAPVTGANLTSIRYIKINLSVNLSNTNFSLSTAVFPRYAS
jgi:prepilin-type N-terminal cleavage/methylation domain-containing protein